MPVKKKPVKKVIAKKAIAKKPVKENSGKNWYKALGIANVIGFIAVIIVNYLATSLPIGGHTTGEVANMYTNLFTPASLTFSIRGVIYLFLGAFVVWQLIDVFKKKSLGIAKKIGLRFLATCLTNIGRIFARHYLQVGISVLIMLLLLVVLIIVVTKIGKEKTLNTNKEKRLVSTPFNLYLGWISIAIIANISTRLVYINRSMRGISEITRTMIMIIIGAILGLTALYKKYNVIFGLVVVRAFIGIIIKRVNLDPTYTQSIIRTAGICIAVLTGMIGLSWKKRLDK